MPPQHPPTTDTDRLTHELQVHQAELESQNEELRRASGWLGPQPTLPCPPDGATTHRPQEAKP